MWISNQTYHHYSPTSSWSELLAEIFHFAQSTESVTRIDEFNLNKRSIAMVSLATQILSFCLQEGNPTENEQMKL